MEEQHNDYELSPMGRKACMETAYMYMSAARALMEKADYDGALTSYLDARKKLEEAECYDTMDMAHCVGDIALMYFMKDDFDQALPNYQQALKIIGAQPTDDLYTADLCMGAGICLYRKEQYSDALPLLERAYATFKKEIPQGDNTTTNAYNFLQATRRKLGLPEEPAAESQPSQQAAKPKPQQTKAPTSPSADAPTGGTAKKQKRGFWSRLFGS